MMQIVESIAEWKKLRRSAAFDGKSIGFVPTMGALHEGHSSLLDRSHSSHEVSVLSIFVNPTQFNDPKDLKNYPRDLDADLEIAARAGTNFVFLPKPEEIYSDNYRFQVTENELSSILCGAHRPGHFTGVLSVVMKLLNLVRPEKAYFGEKDFQQFLLIKGMADAFFMDVEIIGCPTVRAKDGLALSSRNILLSSDDRKKAPLFPQYLSSKDNPEEISQKLTHAGFEVDYLEEHYGRRFGAVRLGNVRLIDNVQA